MSSPLTFIQLGAHNLAASVVEADGETRTIWFDVTEAAIVPMNTGNTDCTLTVGETVHVQLVLKI